MTKKISYFSLVLLIIAAIDNIRNLPASALFGSALIFFFIFAAVLFLICGRRGIQTRPRIRGVPFGSILKGEVRRLAHKPVPRRGTT